MSINIQFPLTCRSGKAIGFLSNSNKLRPTGRQLKRQQYDLITWYSTQPEVHLVKSWGPPTHQISTSNYISSKICWKDTPHEYFQADPVFIYYGCQLSYIHQIKTSQMALVKH